MNSAKDVWGHFWASYALPIMLLIPPVVAAVVVKLILRNGKINKPFQVWGFFTIILYPVFFGVLAAVIFITGVISK